MVLIGWLIHGRQMASINGYFKRLIRIIRVNERLEIKQVVVYLRPVIDRKVTNKTTRNCGKNIVFFRA